MALKPNVSPDKSEKNHHVHVLKAAVNKLYDFNIDVSDAFALVPRIADAGIIAFSLDEIDQLTEEQVIETIKESIEVFSELKIQMDSVYNKYTGQSHDAIREINPNLEYAVKNLEFEVSCFINRYRSLVVREFLKLKISTDEFALIKDNLIKSISDDLVRNITALASKEFNREEIWREISSRVVNEVGGSSELKNSVKTLTLDAPPNGERYISHAKPGEDIVSFLKRVYDEPGFLTGAFTRADLRKIDPDAVVALETWEQGTRTRPKGRAPLKLPTRTERNNELRSADPDTLTDAEKLARNRLLAIQKYQTKRMRHEM